MNRIWIRIKSSGFVILLIWLALLILGGWVNRQMHPSVGRAWPRWAAARDLPANHRLREADLELVTPVPTSTPSATATSSPRRATPSGRRHTATPSARATVAGTPSPGTTAVPPSEDSAKGRPPGLEELVGGYLATPKGRATPVEASDVRKRPSLPSPVPGKSVFLYRLRDEELPLARLAEPGFTVALCAPADSVPTPAPDAAATPASGADREPAPGPRAEGVCGVGRLLAVYSEAEPTPRDWLVLEVDSAEAGRVTSLLEAEKRLLLLQGKP